ncbi:formate dehydrogenase subunit gamma [Campylobacter geochelonis]|uniref:Formate dehydrogenase, cytochrome B subunit n=1 Tax=Campylobacter geochelonis TaxID=1780362 RepID=A0A128EF53_9BACT|nr:formate dehydrogenase subunit gamma [Campylobacter geochelonis]QKF72023.1 formate dehydrogenase N, cytochrome b-556 subunit [Campylobacter geochelonis]CZE46888.1 formate dehydrogenase%2C cytochrome B subunit [Campylobacter geochelonis]
MRKILFFITLATGLFADNKEFIDQIQGDSSVWGEGRFINIPTYYDNGFAKFFVDWQGNGYFAMLAAVAILAVIVAFAGHYAIVGPKHFSHSHGKIYAFNVIERLVHLIAAVAWVVLVPTGVIMMFGEEFGGGFFVRLCKNLHGLATILFAISLIPMFAFWFVRMLPATYDLKWMFMVGGYLSKNKKPIPAGKFNAGQKAWFWVATVGGFFMIVTGALMYFLDYPAPVINETLGLSQIDVLRLSAIVHNILGAACAVFLLVHIYMAVFAIKGSIHAIITGYKEEEEVYILHHYWYQELLKKGEIKPSVFEQKYTNLK